MKFQEYREKKIAPEEVESHAECLAAMDCLMHHMSDEDELACWQTDGVPDNDHWRLLRTVAPGPAYAVAADRARFYRDIAEGMTYGDYEGCVKIFACAVEAQCFTMKYTPRAFI